MAAPTENASGWGPLSHPIRTAVPDGAPPWRDNAFLCFWDAANDVYGTLHTSTSPNAEGRRARLSVTAGGNAVELIEDLASGSFSSPHITFEAGAGFSVEAPRVSGEVWTQPHLALADYTGDHAPTALGLQGGEPLKHYQRPARVRGSLVLDGRPHHIDGFGFRDRTWGPRDESVSMVEYFGYMFTLQASALTVIRTLGSDGASNTVGFLLEDTATPVTEAVLARDASGLFSATTVTLADGRRLVIEATDRHAGFWCPLGTGGTGPTMSAYDEFVSLRAEDGRVGSGLIEQGVAKRLS